MGFVSLGLGKCEGDGDGDSDGGLNGVGFSSDSIGCFFCAATGGFAL